MGCDWGPWSTQKCILGKGASTREIEGIGALGTEVGDLGYSGILLNQVLSSPVCVL